METLRLVVGLGNPGREYAHTRHNAGFMLVDRLADQAKVGWRMDAILRARVAEARWGDKRCWLAQPMTFMNASGEAVGALARYYRLDPEQVLVAVDDADLPLGELRLRPQGGSGGHHGLESIAQHLGTKSYPRLRLGIGRRAEDGRQITGHVLGRFAPDEADCFAALMDRAADAVRCWAEVGIAIAMNRYNGTMTVPGTKDS